MIKPGKIITHGRLAPPAVMIVQGYLSPDLVPGGSGSRTEDTVKGGASMWVPIHDEYPDRKDNRIFRDDDDLMTIIQVILKAIQ